MICADDVLRAWAVYVQTLALATGALHDEAEAENQEYALRQELLTATDALRVARDALLRAACYPARGK